MENTNPGPDLEHVKLKGFNLLQVMGAVITVCTIIIIAYEYFL